MLAGLFASAPAVFAVSPAFAENQQVQVEDNAFVLPAVAVKPGESVTFTYPGNPENGYQRPAKPAISVPRI